MGLVNSFVKGMAVETLKNEILIGVAFCCPTSILGMENSKMINNLFIDEFFMKLLYNRQPNICSLLLNKNSCGA